MVDYATVFENGYVTIMKGTWKIRVMKVADIPITYGGKAVHNIMNCFTCCTGHLFVQEY